MTPNVKNTNNSSVKLSESEKNRYQRQILALGIEAQETLKSKTVLQVGAGGLGAPLSLYLVAAGIGELILFEMDSLDLSNLGRQILYSTKNIGEKKGDLALQRLKELNPNVRITIINKPLTKDSVRDYIDRVDYLVDASDNFETKFLINDLGLEYNIPFTIAGIQQFDGQLISVDPHKTACYRCIFGEPIKTDKSKPIAVVAPTCGVLGSLEANEVIKGLLGIGKRALNQIFMVSLRDNDFTSVPVKINSKCKCQQIKEQKHGHNRIK